MKDWEDRLEDAVFQALEAGASEDDVRDTVTQAIASWNEEQEMAAS